jgi:hypothetical protein
MKITRYSKVSEVSAYVGEQLSHYEFVDVLVGFVEKNKIGGKRFLALKEDDLIQLGLEYGDRLELIELVDRKGDEYVQKDSKRQERWQDLNEILEKKKRFKTNDDGRGSIAYSYVSWSDVESVFGKILVNYDQPCKEIPEDIFTCMSTYLGYLGKCFGSVISGKEAKRLHFIAPILSCVCCIFNGGVEILVETSLAGNHIRTTGNFEFILKKGGKRICIVEAKKDDMEQGMTQDLLGCEAVADVENLSVVYGIVKLSHRVDLFEKL